MQRIKRLHGSMLRTEALAEENKCSKKSIGSGDLYLSSCKSLL